MVVLRRRVWLEVFRQRYLETGKADRRVYRPSTAGEKHLV